MVSAPTATPAVSASALSASALSSFHTDKNSDKGDGGTEAIVRLVEELNVTMDATIGEINEINASTKLLALNARIEAARAGSYGAAFGVVASEIQKLSASTADAANQMANQTRQTIDNLLSMIRNNIRGTRLSDLALVNIDLIDRNLYERTCDVRWWATDPSLIAALTDATEDAHRYAGRRMGVILDSYTVYCDLVLADANGRIVANGRPSKFSSVGKDVSRTNWFTRAKSTRSSEEFGFESAHRNVLVDSQAVLVYSAAVRTGGQTNGSPLGVLGVLFDWESLAQTILKNVPLPEKERHQTRCVIADNEGNLLADSQNRHLLERIPTTWLEPMRSSPKGFTSLRVDGREYCLGFAKSPGFETYATGWNSLILQPV